MSETPVMQSEDDYYCWAVFDPITKKLKYSKYNFLFEEYRSDKTYSNELTQNQLFYNFLKENETDIWKPFTVKSELTKYFNVNDNDLNKQMQEYFDDFGYLLYQFNFNPLSTYKNWSFVLDKEFILHPYNYFNEVPNLCEFLHDNNGKILCKYNFKFEEYSNDFNVYGSKIAIFFDLMLRLNYLTENLQGFIGYKNIPEKFIKYFYTDDDSQRILELFLENNSIFSCFPNVRQSPNNINYEHYMNLINNKYLNNLEFKITNTTEAKKYFLKYGQFQQDEIKFIPEKSNEILEVSKAVCSIYTESGFGTGVLLDPSALSYAVVNGVKQIYLCTCYHIIANNNNKSTIFAGCYYKEKIEIKLLFRIIGYDKHTDLCIALYDETLDYNKNLIQRTGFNDIRENLKLLLIDADIEQYIGQEILTIGNTGLYDNSSYLSGKIIDPNYSGDFNRSFVLNNPSTILTDIHVCKGQSGSPLLIRNPHDNLLKCVGIINCKIGDDYQYSLGISSHLFFRIIISGISYWYSYVKKFGINDNENLSFNIKEIFPKKWLGIKCCYYNPQTASRANSAFGSFSINGGIVIKNFIIGFNTITKNYIFNSEDLAEQGVIKLDTLLLKTKMYSNFILNNKVPIVLTSIKMYDRVNGVYNNFKLGKYAGQHSFDILTFGFMQTGTDANDPRYTNLIKRLYTGIQLQYSYYNGFEWVSAIEYVGGIDDQWYNEYSDSYGHSFYQHKIEFPRVLDPYISEFGNDNAEWKLNDNAEWKLNGNNLIIKKKNRKHDNINF